MPCGKLKHRYWFFADAPNIAREIVALFEEIYDNGTILTVISNIGECTIPFFQLIVWCENWVAYQHYRVFWKQL